MPNVLHFPGLLEMGVQHRQFYLEGIFPLFLLAKQETKVPHEGNSINFPLCCGSVALEVEVMYTMGFPIGIICSLLKYTERIDNVIWLSRFKGRPSPPQIVFLAGECSGVPGCPKLIDLKHQRVILAGISLESACVAECVILIGRHCFHHRSIADGSK